MSHSLPSFLKVLEKCSATRCGLTIDMNVCFSCVVSQKTQVLRGVCGVGTRAMSDAVSVLCLVLCVSNILKDLS